jgi:hypothetical protein
MNMKSLLVFVEINSHMALVDYYSLDIVLQEGPASLLHRFGLRKRLFCKRAIPSTWIFLDQNGWDIGSLSGALCAVLSSLGSSSCEAACPWQEACL